MPEATSIINTRLHWRVEAVSMSCKKVELPHPKGGNRSLSRVIAIAIRGWWARLIKTTGYRNLPIIQWFLMVWSLWFEILKGTSWITGWDQPKNKMLCSFLGMVLVVSFLKDLICPILCMVFFCRQITMKQRSCFGAYQPRHRGR